MSLCVVPLIVASLHDRWYVLQNNFLYWYTGDSRGSKLLGVLYLDGSYVLRQSDDVWAAKGYFGFVIYTRSVQAMWGFVGRLF
jgi:hypothetical protein